MRGHNSTECRRIAAGIMGIMVLVIVLFSAFFIAAEAGHDCEGEDCPICVCIEQCESTLHQIGDGAATLTSVVVPAVFFVLAMAYCVCELPRETLVSRKIRLNN